MPWVKLDDGFPFHRKAILAGKDARALYITALCWASGQLTDGYLDSAVVPTLCAVSEVTNVKEVTERLVEVGLWEREDSGYSIHDYHDYNPTAEEAIAVREARAEAGRKGGVLSGESKRKAKSEANAIANAKQNQTPFPFPSPRERDIPTGAENAPVVPSTFEQWREGYRKADNPSGYAGWMLTQLYPTYYSDKVKPNYGMLGKLLKTHDAEYVLSLIFQNSARPPSGDPLRFVSGILAKRGNGAAAMAVGLELDEVQDPDLFFAGGKQ